MKLSLNVVIIVLVFLSACSEDSSPSRYIKGTIVQNGITYVVDYCSGVDGIMVDHGETTVFPGVPYFAMTNDTGDTEWEGWATSRLLDYSHVEANDSYFSNTGALCLKLLLGGDVSTGSYTIGSNATAAITTVNLLSNDVEFDTFSYSFDWIALSGSLEVYNIPEIGDDMEGHVDAIISNFSPAEIISFSFDFCLKRTPYGD